jgi:hypothetical protein
MPAAPPSSIQKAIIKKGANGAGMGGVDRDVPGAFCPVSAINEALL